MNLYELTENAVGQHQTYKHPDLEEWINSIDQILEALGQTTIDDDCIEYLYLSEDALEIRTGYSVRGCYSENDMSVPIEILKDTNPLQRAKQIYITKQLEQHQYELNDAQKKLESAQKKFETTKQLYEENMQ